MKQAQKGFIIQFKNPDGIMDDDEEVEITRCPECNSVFGVDVSYTDEFGDEVVCPMCEKEIRMPYIDLETMKTYKIDIY